MIEPRFSLLSTLLLSLWLVSLDVTAQQTALDNYVAKDDSNYRFTILDRNREIGYTTLRIDMISQQWRSPHEVDRVLWQHEVVIAIPEVPFSDPDETAILLIDGGRNDNDPIDDDILEIMGGVAVLTNSVTVLVRQIPNQPLFFADEVDNGRKEDAILAYSFDKFLATGDEEWPVHLAMTKAVVRAMDTAQTVVSQEGEQIDGFVVLGASKRGWTTWLTAAVDPRVKGIVPISIDLLNLGEQFRHHWGAYGFFAPAIEEYVDFDIPCRIQTERGRELLEIVDPYSYRERYTMPKYLVNSTGDQFFVSDSSQFYYQDLPEPKSLRYTINTDHRQGDLENLLANTLIWIDDAKNNVQAPQYSWTLEDGSIRVQATDRPDKVYLWQATNPNARDFRLESIGAAWTRTELPDLGGGMYIGSVPTPAQGFTAFLVEVVYEEDLAIGDLLTLDLKFTTDALVVPDVLPFENTYCADGPAPSQALDRVGLYTPATALTELGGGNGDAPEPIVFTASAAGSGWLAVAGDWDGDGITTLGLYDPDNAVFHLYNANTVDATRQSIAYGPPGQNWIPVVGDWDGDGVDTIGLYDPGAAVFHLRNSNTPGFAELGFAYGPPGLNWTPLSGDWNGDGVDTIGLYNPEGAVFHLRNSNTPGFADLGFAYGSPNSGWLPLSGDWNGDGIDTIALFRPGDSRFLLKNDNSAGFADLGVFFGSNGANVQVLSGDWD